MMYDELGAHMEFCARTGNEERGLDVLHRNFDCVSFSFRAVEGMWAMAAVALLCLRAAAKGLDRDVCVPCHCGGVDEDCDWLPLVTYAKLAKQLRWAALDHAEHLRELDGTPHLFEAVDALLFAEPVVERLELGSGPGAGPGAG
ncbi:hypothetical protein, partial [Actinomadura sp. CNU-125]|uniref:hypothetical protein n=1 Tax=Actinomadura sp. CNU-125 TaxID=1904961 RepID=UPI0021CC63BD